MSRKKTKSKRIAYMKIIIPAVVTVVCALLSVPLFSEVNNGEITEVNGNENKINSDNVDIENIENYFTEITDTNTINIENKYIWKDYDFESRSENELFRMAKAAYMGEDYEYMYEIYTSSPISNATEALLNRGYLLSSGKIEREDSFQKAIECYMSIEEKDERVYRNLLAATLKNKTQKKGNTYDPEKLILEGLLYIYDDDVTWDYMSYCYFGMPLNQYCDTYGCDIDDVKSLSFDMAQLYEFKEDGRKFLTYSPSDTDFVKYIWIDDNNNICGTTHIYEAYKPCYYVYIDKLESPYFEE